ncbi:MAG TPA: sensor domain-containing diguanylate cyclase [Bacilli bacterium]|nr:sensor domain-containing diguanylate cyclase [Bacilli bacterium]
MKQSIDKMYQYLVIAIAVLLLSTYDYHTLLQPNTIPLLLLGILVELIQIPLGGRGYGSLTYGVVLGTLVLYGPSVAGPLVALAVLCEALFRKNKRNRLINFFNAAQYSISAFLAYQVYLAFDGPMLAHTLLAPAHLFILIPVTVVYMIINHLFIYILYALRKEFRVADIPKLFATDAINYLISTPFAIFMLAFSNYLPVIFLTFLPLVLLGQVLKLYQKITQMNRVHEVTYHLQSEFDLQTIYTTVVHSAKELTNCAAVVLWVLREDKVIPVCVTDESLLEQLPQNGISLTDTGIVVNAVKNKRVELVNDVWKDRRVKSIKGKAHFESILVVPLRSRDNVVGVITCYGARAYLFTQESTELITVLAAQVGVIIENANLYRELSEATLRDPGTGLYNYRYFYQELDHRFRLANEQNKHLSVVIIDIDHFKKYNDTYGHVVGDEVLRQTGQVIQATAQNGVCARYGGEEFALLLDADLEEARHTAEQIRRAVAHHKFEYQGYTVQGVTLSIGVATFPDHDQDAKELLEKADQAMYWGAKQRGRNKVAIYTPDFDAHLFVDKLTGLYTYHYLQMKMKEEFTHNHTEHGQPFALIFLNIVDFTSINRTFGFDVGNHVLRELSVIIKENVRHGEVAARYGGDEFLLLIPGVERIEAKRIKERLQRAVLQNPFRVKDNVIVRVMVKMDAIIFPEDAADEPQLLSLIPEAFVRLSSDYEHQNQNA